MGLKAKVSTPLEAAASKLSNIRGANEKRTSVGGEWKDDPDLDDLWKTSRIVECRDMKREER